MRRDAGQLRLALKAPRTHGGRRRGAGRKPANGEAGVSHHGRPEVSSRTPVHVTLRLAPGLPNLRGRPAFAVVERALEGMLPRTEFRVVHFSALGNHLHLIVEADDNRSLSDGVQGLSVRIAKGLNRVAGRRGKVFADRFHAHALRTPAEVRRALAYVLLNDRSHRARGGEAVGRGRLDAYSSAGTFDGIRQIVMPERPRVTAAPRTWLLDRGWKKHGELSLDEVPAVKPKRAV